MIKLKKIISILTVAVILLLCSCSADNYSVSVDVLDIGKADCIVINTGTKTVMIDTGEEENLPDIQAFLRQEDIQAIDMLILTHFDKDHIGGAKGIISEYDVKTVIETTFQSDREEYFAYHKEMTDKGITPITITENYNFELESCAFTVYAPKQDSYSKKQDNNSSLIVAMEYGEKRFLFCGDAMELRLDEFVEDLPGKFDFVKLPYHGIYLNNYPKFLNEVSPKYAVMTCSDKNPADKKTIELLKENGVIYYETRLGSVGLKTDGKSIRFNR